MGASPMEVVASGSGVLQGVVDDMSGVVAVAKDVRTRASTLVGLAHEYLMPEGTKVPNGLDARVSAFGPGTNLLEGLVAENVVSGLSTSLVVLMGLGISIDSSLVEAIPDYTNDQSERATKLARRLQKLWMLSIPPPRARGRRRHVLSSCVVSLETCSCKMSSL